MPTPHSLTGFLPVTGTLGQGDEANVFDRLCGPSSERKSLSRHLTRAPATTRRFTGRTPCDLTCGSVKSESPIEGAVIIPEGPGTALRGYSGDIHRVAYQRESVEREGPLTGPLSLCMSRLSRLRVRRATRHTWNRRLHVLTATSRGTACGLRPRYVARWDHGITTGAGASRSATASAAIHAEP